MQKFDPAFTARAIVAKVGTNQCTTRGCWVDVIEQIHRLPPRLQRWTWKELSSIMEPEAYAYLRSFSKGLYRQAVPA
jgi:hypothetical protein